MPGFIRTRDGMRLLLDDAETDLIRRLTGELRALLLSDEQDDPVTERLFPSVYEDERDEAAYREIVGDGLLREKLEALDEVSGALGDGGSDVMLVGESLDPWLASLTDLRLALGVRLEVDEARMATEIDPSDPDAQALAILHWLGLIQEGILRAIDP